MRAGNPSLQDLVSVAQQVPNMLVEGLRLGCEEAMFQRILVSWRRSGSLRPTVHPATRLALDRGRRTGRALARPGAASRARLHRCCVSDVCHDFRPFLITFSPGCSPIGGKAVPGLSGICFGEVLPFAPVPVSTLPTMA